MASELQIRTARINGAKSRGPITPQGKARSGHKPDRHERTARTVVLASEDPAPFRALCETLTAAYRPETEYEKELVSQLAGARWKLRRCTMAEKGIVEKALAEMRRQVREGLPGADDAMVARIALQRMKKLPQLQPLRRYRLEVRREELHATSMLGKVRMQEPLAPTAPKRGAGRATTL